MAKLSEIDRRWVFLCVAVALVTALVFPFRQRFTPAPTVRSVYDCIESLPEGSAVLIGCDYDPQARAEVVPMTRVLLKHCFQRNLRVIGMTFWVEGVPLHRSIFEDVARSYGKVNGRDYVYLGWRPGGYAQVLTALGDDSFVNTFENDARDRPTATMPIFQDVKTLRDVSYMFNIGAGLYIGSWIAFGSDKYKVDMGAGGVSILGPELYVYLSTGQLNGVIAGLRGAADYETLIEQPEQAVEGMAAQSTVHAVIVLFVLIGNVIYFHRRYRHKRGGIRPGE